MPLKGYKSVTVPEEAYDRAKRLVRLGLEETIGKAAANALKEYEEKRAGYIKEILSVRAKWSQGK